MPSLQTEIEDMIWEVDEDCDQGLNWAEFQAMYHRCNNDKTGEQIVTTLVLHVPAVSFIAVSQPLLVLLQDMSPDGFLMWSSLS